MHVYYYLFILIMHLFQENKYLQYTYIIFYSLFN